MSPHRLTFSQVSVLPVVFITAVVTIGAWVISSEPKRLPNHAGTYLLGMLLAWMGVTTAFAVFQQDAFDKWIDTAKIIGFNGFVTLGLISTRERIHALIWVIVISIGYLGTVGGLGTIITGGQFRVFGPQGGFLEENNGLALGILLTIPLMRYLYVVSEALYVRLTIGGVMALSLVSVLGSHSRGAFLGLAALAGGMFLKTRSKALVGIFFSIFVVGAFFAMPEKWVNRMLSIGEFGEDNSALQRIDAWLFAIDTAKEKPLVGGGFEVFALNVDVGDGRALNAHSIYFQVLGEHGWVGLAIFVLLGLVVYRTAGQTVSAAKGHEGLFWVGELSRMIQVSLLTYGVAGAFLTFAYFELVYQLIAVAIVANVLARQEVLSAREPDLISRPSYA